MLSDRVSILSLLVRLPPPVLAAALPSSLPAPLSPPSRLGALELSERQRLDAGGVRLGKYASSAATDGVGPFEN